MTTASAYLSGIARVFERVEVTGSRGAPYSLDDGIAQAVDLVLSLTKGGKALLIGNGGSAAIVSHIHNDLCKAVGVRAMVLTETPLLTALANDDGYETVFHRPISLWADRGDLLIAVSSSGESNNITKAATEAAARGCRLLTMTGFKPGNRLRQMGDINIYVPDSSYGYVEMTHSVLGHCITDTAVQRRQ
jgi:D-sedoheptulose 7-phosphate isomerase